jgi:hypothetical protein
VRAIVDKFNRDYLMRPDWRQEYKKLVVHKDSVHYSPCVRYLLTNKRKKVKMDRIGACEGCVEDRLLCARFHVEVNGYVKLVVYLLAVTLRRDVEWSEVGFWVRG